jgi:hypothetical protein
MFDCLDRDEFKKKKIDKYYMQVIDTYLVFMCANLPVLYVIELYWNDQGRSKIKYFIADVPWSPWSMSIMPRGQLRCC